jgi:hypothetical protein
MTGRMQTEIGATIGTAQDTRASAAWTRGRGVVAHIALVTTLLLAAFQLLMWVAPMAARGGPDSYTRRIDFAATLTGARIIRDGDGARLYDLATQRAAQAEIFRGYVSPDNESVLPYLHPPFEALAIAPLLGLGYGTLYLLWSALIIGAFAGSLALLARALPLTGAARWLLPTALCSYQALYQSLWLGQSSPLILLGLTGAFVALRRGRDGWAGAALALVAVKPQMLLVVALVLLLTGRWRPLVACGGVLGALTVAAMPLLGPLWPLQYARFLAGIGDWSGDFQIYPAIMHNWRGLTYNLLDRAAPALVGPLASGLALLTLGGLAWAAWRARSGRRGTTWTARHDFLWALACVAAVLVAPHLNAHDLTILALPAWIVVARLVAGRADRAARGWAALLWAVYLLALLIPTIADRYPAAPVVPKVTLFAVAALLLGWQVIGSPGTSHPPTKGTIVR